MIMMTTPPSVLQLDLLGLLSAPRRPLRGLGTFTGEETRMIILLCYFGIVVTVREVKRSEPALYPMCCENMKVTHPAESANMDARRSYLEESVVKR